MNTRLKNRKVVEILLGPAIEEVAISPEVVITISEGPIDLAWVKALEELDKRSVRVNRTSQTPNRNLAVSDLKPLLNDLTNKVLLG